MSSASQTPKSTRYTKQKKKILVPSIEENQNLKYLLDFNNQNKEDQENIFKFLQDNHVKFDKKIPNRVYEAVVTLKNINEKDIKTISKEVISPRYPPDISPEKVELYKQKKQDEKNKHKLKYTLNMYGEKVYEQDVVQRLTQNVKTSDRWRIKQLDQLQKKFDNQKEKNKMKLHLNNIPSNRESPNNSHYEYQNQSGNHKRTVSFKMSEDKNNYVTFNANQQHLEQETFETFEQMQQSIHNNSNANNKLRNSSMIIQDQFDASLNISSNKIANKSDFQVQILKSSLKLHKIPQLNVPSNTNKNIPKKLSFIDKENQNKTQNEMFRKVDDSFVDITNQNNLHESLLLIQNEKQKTGSSMTFIPLPIQQQNQQNINQYSRSYSPFQGKILDNILSDEEMDTSIIKSNNIPKKINKTNTHPQSYIQKIQKEKEDRQKIINKSITNLDLKNIKSKVSGYINSSRTPKKINHLNNNKSSNIQELKNSFLDNLRQSTSGKPIPKQITQQNNKMNISLNLSSSPQLKASSVSDSKYNSIDKSQILSKALDPTSQKQFEILQKHNDNLKIKSGLQFHKYSLVGQEENIEKKAKDNKNLTKSQILNKYAEKEKTESLLTKSNTFEWELTDEDISELDNNEEITPKHYNMMDEQYKKWWFGLDDSQKMHYFSSEELVKYYKHVKINTQESLHKYLKNKKIKRTH